MKTSVWIGVLWIGVFGLLASCSSGGGAPRSDVAPIAPYQLSETSRELLSEEPAVSAELERVLEEYFGAPGAPKMRRLPAWEETGFDPNGSPFDGVRPAFELSGLSLAALHEDNLLVWAAALEAIDSGRATDVGPFSNRPAMSEGWSELLARRDELAPTEFRERSREFFGQRYPDLREAGQLFGLFCARCHGPEGGGDGPMSQRLNTKPRDYRRGRFKFAAVEGAHKPRRADLLRTLLHGLPGSAMPSFRILTNAELNALIDYVRLLSIRGEVEAIVVGDWFASGTSPMESVDEIYELVWARWLEADAHAVELEMPAPDDDLARLELGRAVFLDPARGNCFRCHGPEGRGDGPSALRVESDGGKFALLKDEWDHFILPRDLTSGIFRGGDQREDVYLRVHCGIPGTPMPSLGESVGMDGQALLDAEETWALVDYVLSLSGRGPFGAASHEVKVEGAP